MHAVWNIYPSPKYMFSLLYEMWEKYLCAFKYRNTLLALITICTEIILSSKTIQLHTEIHLKYWVHIAS